jgi:hypothetical protein
MSELWERSPTFAIVLEGTMCSQDEIGMAFPDYLAHVRVGKAKELLEL